MGFSHTHSKAHALGVTFLGVLCHCPYSEDNRSLFSSLYCPFDLNVNCNNLMHLFNKHKTLNIPHTKQPYLIIEPKRL